MIRTIKHAGLKRLFERDETKGLTADKIKRIKAILFALETATSPEQLNLFPGARVHPLKGDLKGYWSASISGNWRIIFRYDEGDVYDVDLVDYH
jgi:proteic killer suppression protein